VDPNRRKLLIYIGGALLLVAVALLVVAYVANQSETSDSPTVPKPPDLGMPGSGLITATPDATSGTEPSSTSGDSNGGLSASEAAALEAELSAIEKELDAVSMPDDSDFKDIESGLQ